MVRQYIQKFKKFTRSDRNVRANLFRDSVDGLTKRVIAIVAGVPLIAILFVLRLFVIVRIGTIDSLRIGHLLGRTEFWLRARSGKKRGRLPEKDIFFCKVPPVNQQALRMIQRKVTVIESNFWFSLIQIIMRYLPSGPWIYFTDTGLGGKSAKIWISAPPQLSFTEVEQKKGREIMTSLGMTPEDSFVCFSNRDSAYLDKAIKNANPEGWSYHNFRDSDIKNYLPAAEYVTSQGMRAIRMGAVVKGSLETNNPKIIDYAVQCRSELADMFLMKHCKFFLGDTAGTCLMAAIFDVPIIMANAAPLGSAPRRPHDLLIPKKYWSIEQKRFMTFSEIFDMGAYWWHNINQFTKVGIEVIENTNDEILAVTKEMMARLDGTWVQEDGDEELQNLYKNLFPATHKVHGFYSRVGAEFLRQNRELLGLNSHRAQPNYSKLKFLVKGGNYDTSS